MLKRTMRLVAQTTLLAVALQLVAWPIARAAGGDVCPERNDGFENACRIGAPDANGMTLKGYIAQPGDIDAYEFTLGPSPASVHITLADLWFDTDISVYESLTGRFIAQARFIAESRRSGQAQSQMSAPELIVERLEPGSYTAFIYSGDLLSFHPDRGYTYRVAVGPPTVPQPSAPSGQEPSWKQQGYQLSLAMEPGSATQFSLLTFTAFVDPSFTDLFDFAWELDGQLLPNSNEPVLQLPASALGEPMFGRHTVKVVAIGARQYPDPDRPHMPPTLSATGAFEVKKAG